MGPAWMRTGGPLSPFHAHARGLRCAPAAAAAAWRLSISCRSHSGMRFGGPPTAPPAGPEAAAMAPPAAPAIAAIGSERFGSIGRVRFWPHATKHCCVCGCAGNPEHIASMAKWRSQSGDAMLVVVATTLSRCHATHQLTHAARRVAGCSCSVLCRVVEWCGGWVASRSSGGSPVGCQGIAPASLHRDGRGGQRAEGTAA